MAEKIDHRTLRELAAIWLRGRRCYSIAFEVHLDNFELHTHHKWNDPLPRSYNSYRHYTDVVGVSNTDVVGVSKTEELVSCLFQTARMNW